MQKKSRVKKHEPESNQKNENTKLVDAMYPSFENH